MRSDLTRKGLRPAIHFQRILAGSGLDELVAFARASWPHGLRRCRDEPTLRAPIVEITRTNQPDRLKAVMVVGEVADLENQ